MQMLLPTPIFFVIFSFSLLVRYISPFDFFEERGKLRGEGREEGIMAGIPPFCSLLG